MIMNWFIMGYFVVLFIERMQSIVRSFTDSNISMWGDGFDKYVNGICILSLGAFLVLLFLINRDFLQSLFVKDAVVNMKNLSITIGVILVSGMVHTEHTIPGIQFASYGLLIVAFVISTAKNNAASGNSILLWMSLVYLIFFSMAIPVVYKSGMENAAVFHVIESIVSLVLVACFAYMTYLIFAGNAVNLFMILPIIIALVGDAVVLALRWKEEVNSFVLIFIIASAVMWLIGTMVRLIQK